MEGLVCWPGASLPASSPWIKPSQPKQAENHPLGGDQLAKSVRPLKSLDLIRWQRLCKLHSRSFPLNMHPLTQRRRNVDQRIEREARNTPSKEFLNAWFRHAATLSASSCVQPLTRIKAVILPINSERTRRLVNQAERRLATLTDKSSFGSSQRMTFSPALKDFSPCRIVLIQILRVHHEE